MGFYLPPGSNIHPDFLPVAIPLSGDAHDRTFLNNSLMAFHEDMPLLHYISWEHFVSLIENRKLHLRRLDTFTDDKYEGTYPHANRSEEATISAELTRGLHVSKDLEKMIFSNEVIRHYSYAHCWFGNDRESLDMWKKYGENARGVCIRSSTFRISRAVFPPGDKLSLHGGKMTYVDDATPIPTLVSFGAAFRKNPKFRNENEYRILAIIPPEHIPKDAKGFLIEASAYECLEVSLPNLIEGVLWGPECGVDEIEKRFRFMQERLPEISANGSALWKPK